MIALNLKAAAVALLLAPLAVLGHHGKPGCKDLITRPEIDVGPYHTGKPFPHSPHRDPHKICKVKGKAHKDSSKDILRAMHKCNNGGTVVLEGKLLVAKPLDLTFLKHIDVAITGTIKFTDDWEYWVANSFKYPFQDSSTFWRWGGEDVNIFGNGVGEIDGSGQIWYNMAPYNATLLRPILFLTDQLHGAQISGIRMINSPNWFNLYHNSSDIIVSDMILEAWSTNATVRPRNTDGFDTLRSDNIIVQNSYVDNTDDCVSFKPNTTSVIIQGLQCNGSHGISVGSLGQYKGEVDIVEDLYIYNNSMSNATDGARLKVWPDVVPGDDSTNVGGGLGRVKNITYHDFYVENDDLAIQIDQCYGQKNRTLCNQYPSLMTMSDVLFKNFKGTTSEKFDPRVGQLICSAPEVCVNIRAEDVKVTPPSGKDPIWTCDGFDFSGLEGFNCQPAT